MIPLGEAAMKKFLQRFSSHVIGVLSGLDRIRFRGTKRLLSTVGGLFHYLRQREVLLKDFTPFALAMTQTMKQGVEEQVRAWGHPVNYLNSSQIRKEDKALELAQERDIGEGLVAVLSCVEPCWSFAVRRNRQEKKLELCYQPMKCLHYYHYYLDPRFGLIHTRTQTWFPFTVHVCLNGRERLARDMDKAGIGYVKKENCFLEVADLGSAPRLADQPFRPDWPTELAA